jgi:hypothetical protein
VDTFTGWVEAFPCSTERAKEVDWILITEIIPHFGLSKSLQSDNGPAFKAEVTQGLSRALGIEYHLHCAWHPQSSGKVGKTNELLKRHLAKLAQETHSPLTNLLPVAFIRLRNTPVKQVLSSFKSLYGRPFLTNDLFLNQETTQLISHVTQLAKFQQTLMGIKQVAPREDIKGPPTLLLWWPSSNNTSKSNLGLKHSTLGGPISSYSVYTDGSVNGWPGFLDSSLKSQELELLCKHHISTSRHRTGACLLLMWTFGLIKTAVQKENAYRYR